MIFATIFLTVNHLYPAFASPIESSDSVQSLNLTHRLYVPPDQLCASSGHWLSRACVNDYDDRIWEDACVDKTNPQNVVEYYKFGSCPQYTMCTNTLSPPPKPENTIACVGRPPNPTGDEGRIVVSAGRQVGVYRVGSAFHLNPLDRLVPVRIVNPISLATVSAFLEGTSPH